MPPVPYPGTSQASPNPNVIWWGTGCGGPSTDVFHPMFARVCESVCVAVSSPGSGAVDRFHVKKY